MTELLREWFEAEPWRTSRELFERLQEAHPDLFPDGQLRTLQRRVGRVLRSGVRAGGKWPAGATAKSLVQAGHLSTAVVIADLR